MIDKDKIKEEIERRIKETESIQPKFDQFWAGQISAFKGVIKIIDSLPEEHINFPHERNIVDKVFGAGNLESWEYKEAEALVHLAKEELLKDLQEQKIKNWSEEDEYQINIILHGLDLKRELHKKEGNKVEEERYSTQYNWLKSLKDRIQPQPKQEWSEKDEKIKTTNN